MKYLLTLFSICMFFGQAMAQKISQKEVPAIVLNAVLQKFPKVKDMEWKKKGVDYKVEFDDNKTKLEHELLIAANGKIIKHKQELAVRDLPANIRSVITSKYPGYRIDQVDYIRSHTTIYYKVELEKGRESFDIYLLPSGKIVEKITNK